MTTLRLMVTTVENLTQIGLYVLMGMAFLGACVGLSHYTRRVFPDPDEWQVVPPDSAGLPWVPRPRDAATELHQEFLRQVISRMANKGAVLRELRDDAGRWHAWLDADRWQLAERHACRFERSGALRLLIAALRRAGATWPADMEFHVPRQLPANAT